jgi:hypothetical protein
MPRSIPFAALPVVLAAVVLAPLACSADRASPESDDPTIGPSRLSATGLYADLASRTLAPGVRRFAPAHPSWADGAEKTRYVQLPPGAQIDTRDMDRWIFPVGTKAWKEFWVDGKLVETRLLWKRRPEPGLESWWHVAYAWEPDGSDALATIDGVPSASGTDHDVASQEDCTVCHMLVPDALIGFSAIELSSPAPGAEGGAPPREDTGLLLSLAQEGFFTDPPEAEFVVPGSGVVRDALGYLHGNCGYCHNERLEEIIKRQIRFGLKWSDTTPEQTAVYTTTFHAKMRHVGVAGDDEAIVPGDPDLSQAYLRMIATDLAVMPPLGRKAVDPAGSALIREWILGLPR